MKRVSPNGNFEIDLGYTGPAIMQAAGNVGGLPHWTWPQLVEFCRCVIETTNSYVRLDTRRKYYPIRRGIFTGLGAEAFTIPAPPQHDAFQDSQPFYKLETCVAFASSIARKLMDCYEAVSELRPEFRNRPNKEGPKMYSKEFLLVSDKLQYLLSEAPALLRHLNTNLELSICIVSGTHERCKEIASDLGLHVVGTKLVGHQRIAVHFLSGNADQLARLPAGRLGLCSIVDSSFALGCALGENGNALRAALQASTLHVSQALGFSNAEHLMLVGPQRFSLAEKPVSPFKDCRISAIDLAALFTAVPEQVNPDWMQQEGEREASLYNYAQMWAHAEAMENRLIEMFYGKGSVLFDPEGKRPERPPAPLATNSYGNHYYTVADVQAFTRTHLANMFVFMAQR